MKEIAQPDFAKRFLAIISVLVCYGSILVLSVHQVFLLNSISRPSISNISLIEIILVIAFLLSLIYISIISRGTKAKTTPNIRKARNLLVSFVLGLFLMCIFTM